MNGHSGSGADSRFAANGVAGGGFFSLHGIAGMSGTFSTKVWPQPQASQSGIIRSTRDRSPIPLPGFPRGGRRLQIPHPTFIGRPPAPTRAVSADPDFSVDLGGRQAENDARH